MSSKTTDPLRPIKDQAAAQGWQVLRTAKNHWKFVPADPRRDIVVLPGTPSDHRSMKNAVRALKRQGLRLKNR